MKNWNSFFIVAIFSTLAYIAFNVSGITSFLIFVPIFYALNNTDAKNRGLWKNQKNINIFGQLVTPVICYESFFGHIVSDGINNGGQAIIMMANEQLFSFKMASKYYDNVCRIRAIENNRYLAKISNKGTTCLINNQGKIIVTGLKDKFCLTKFSLPLQNIKTVYCYGRNWILLFYLMQPIIIFSFLFYYCKKK